MRARRVLPAAVLAMLACGIATLVSCSSSTDPADDDDNAPAWISDLAVVDFTATTVTLSWTAPGDDGTTGTAARYEVRASDEFIHSDSWPDAAIVPDPPTPQPAGETENMTIEGLEEGARYFFAVAAFDQAGNWPGPSNCVEVVCFDNTPVVFADAAVEAAVRAALGIPTEPLMRRDVRALLELHLAEQGVTDLGGLEECVNLGILDLRDNAVSDLAPLAGLVAMADLNLTDNAVVDVSPLAGMTSMRHLHLDDNAVQDLAPLASLTAMEILNLARNQVADLAPLVGMSLLRHLRLDGNQIVELAPLASLTALRTLVITNIGATSLAPLADLSALRVLLAASNALTDLEVLADKAQLQYLAAFNNQISDLQPLVDNQDLGEGDTVIIWGNPLSQEALDVQIPALLARGVAVSY